MKELFGTSENEAFKDFSTGKFECKSVGRNLAKGKIKKWRENILGIA